LPEDEGLCRVLRRIEESTGQHPDGGEEPNFSDWNE